MNNRAKVRLTQAIGVILVIMGMILLFTGCGKNPMSGIEAISSVGEASTVEMDSTFVDTMVFARCTKLDTISSEIVTSDLSSSYKLEAGCVGIGSSRSGNNIYIESNVNGYLRDIEIYNWNVVDDGFNLIKVKYSLYLDTIISAITVGIKPGSAIITDITDTVLTDSRVVISHVSDTLILYDTTYTVSSTDSTIDGGVFELYIDGNGRYRHMQTYDLIYSSCIGFNRRYSTRLIM